MTSNHAEAADPLETERSSPAQLSQVCNPDLQNSWIAMQRAALMARQLAVRTNTAIVVMQDGEMVHITAEELRGMGIR